LKKIIIISIFFANLFSSIFADYHGVYFYNPNIIFEWSPKAGNTNFKKTLIKNYELKNKENLIRYINKNKVTKKDLLNTKWYRVKLIRSPYLRAVSCYLHIIIKEARLNLSFEEFLSILKNKKVKYLGKKKYIISHHCGEQYNEEDKYINKFLYLENPENIEELNAKTGLNLNLNSNQPHHTSYIKTYPYYVGHLKFKKNKTGFPPYYCFYSEKSLQLVQEAFPNDTTKYDYEVPEEVLEFIESQKHIENPFKENQVWTPPNITS